MKIWFDLSNSPHINMFYDLIRELEADGHDIVITSRPLANTIALLDQKGLQHTVIGTHYGKNFLKKIFGYPIRVVQLYRFLRPLQPDLAVSQSSFHSPLVAKMLGIPSIYTNDNEHAMGNKPSFFFATSILIPENLDKNKIESWYVPAKKIIQYPGVKEGMYLWKKGVSIHAKRSNLNQHPFKIYIRPEPQTAQYYKGKLNFMDEMLEKLQHEFQFIVLPRDSQQQAHYQNKKFSAVLVPDHPLSFDQIAADCQLFIGAGGSMTREMAILGIPTISVYQDELLDVDAVLLKKKLMIHEPLLDETKLQSNIAQIKNQQPSLELMEKGEAAYKLFKQEILKYQRK